MGRRRWLRFPGDDDWRADRRTGLCTAERAEAHRGGAAAAIERLNPQRDSAGLRPALSRWGNRLAIDEWQPRLIQRRRSHHYKVGEVVQPDEHGAIAARLVLGDDILL